MDKFNGCGQNSEDGRQVNLPYFDLLFRLINEGDGEVEKSFGRHVHWGYWDQPRFAALTAEDFACAAENLSREICKAGKIADGMEVLDVGCGFGGTIAQINERFNRMGLVGLNLDARQLLRARTTVKPGPDNRIQFLRGDACTLPFPDQTFDAVLAVECIFHFPDRRLFFEEAWRVLKPGGFLALSDFIPGVAVLPFTYLKMSLPERLSTGFYGKCNLQCTARGYRKLAGRTRFQLRYERDITRHTLPTYAYLKKLARNRPVFSLAAMLETAAIEGASRFKLMKYYIYAFQKPG